MPTYLLSCRIFPATFTIVGNDLDLPPDTSCTISRLEFDPSPDGLDLQLLGAEAVTLVRKLFAAPEAWVLKVSLKSETHSVEIVVEVFVRKGTFLPQAQHLFQLIAETLDIRPSRTFLLPSLDALDTKLCELGASPALSRSI